MNSYISKSESLSGREMVGRVFQKPSKKTYIEAKVKSLSTRAKNRKKRK